MYEGFAMPSSIRRIDVAGRDVTEHLQTLLRKAGHVFHTSAEKEVVRMIKEKVSYVAVDPKKEEKEWGGGKMGDGKVVEYVLPDGNKLKVSLLFRQHRLYQDADLLGWCRAIPCSRNPLRSRNHRA